MQHIFGSSLMRKKRFWWIGAISATALLTVVIIALTLGTAPPIVTANFPTDTAGLAEAKKQETVTLKNGETYSITIEPVKRVIGGKAVRMLGYNGMVPGPTIDVKQGSTVWIKLTNKLDIETTLHPHGLNADNKSDGVPDVTQPAIKPGQTYTQKLQFPDAGVYWYHPHIREDYTQSSGLYANFIVQPKDQSVWPIVDSQQAMTLSDISLDEKGVAPFSRTVVDHTLMGRFGTNQLVNGRDNYTATVKAGSVVRYYLTNTANVRPFRFAITNAKMKLIGADNGLYEQEKFVDNVVLAPSERAIVDVYFPQEGAYLLQNQTPDKTYTLGMITVTSGQSNEEVVARFMNEATHPEVTASMAKYAAQTGKAPDKRINIQLKMDAKLMGMMSSDSPSPTESIDSTSTSGIEWEDAMPAMNAGSTTKNLTWSLNDLDSKDGKVDWTFNKGDIVKIQIANKSNMHPMQHPVHIHGQRFLVTAIDGQKQTNLVWKDTVMVPAGRTYELIVAMDNPGDWLIHCHIPEHMEAGMIGKFKVK